MPALSIRIKRLRNSAFDRQGGKCYWCGEKMIIKTHENASWAWDHPSVCTADHLILIAHGGKTDASNIAAACRQCNNHRHWSFPSGEHKPNWQIGDRAPEWPRDVEKVT